jgi:DNA polymerase-3 subunit epsilon
MKSVNEFERNRFVAIDFETLNTNRYSVCSVGLVVIENNEITNKKSFKVCPPTKEESYYCVQTHGIHYRDVKNSPLFPTVWKYVDEIIDGCPVIAHNIGFERSCINACNEVYNTNYSYSFIDTLVLSKKFLNLRKNTLDAVCESINYNLNHHHDALADALACANVFLYFKRNNGIDADGKWVYKR